MRAVLLLAAAAASWAAPPALKLDLRTRVEPFKGSGEWRETHVPREFALRETAILICDMWDRHWCPGATSRVDELVKTMAPVVEKARAAGIQIIHAPSEVVDFYRETPQRRRMLAVGKVEPPAPLGLPDPPLPIDDKEGGCETADRFYKAWTRQHPAIGIAANDVISDRADEIYSFLRERGISTLFFMGVHANMCVLNRSFAIKRMTNWGVRCVLVRDLTETMYDPKAAPFVSYRRGAELVIEHIEKHWCPTVTSARLLEGLRHAAPAKPPR